MAGSISPRRRDPVAVPDSHAGLWTAVHDRGAPVSRGREFPAQRALHADGGADADLHLLADVGRWRADGDVRRRLAARAGAGVWTSGLGGAGGVSMECGDTR